MNIFFQFGEFTGEESSKVIDFIIQLVGALIGAGSAILVFWLGLKNERLKGDKQKIELTHEKLRYVNFLLNGVLADTQKQLLGIERFINQQNSNLSKLTIFDITVKNNSERIVNKINQEEYFLAYVRVFDDDNITRLFDLTDYFKLAFDKVLEDIRSNAKYDYDLKVEFKGLVDSLINKIAAYSFVLKQKQNYQDDDLYNILNESIIHYYEVIQKEFDNFLLLRENFIVPLLPQILKYRNIAEVYEIAEIASKANKSLTPVLINKEKFIIDLRETKKDIESQIEKFDKYIKPLDNYLISKNLKITRLEIK